MISHTSNLSTCEAETGRLQWTRGLPDLHSKLQDSLDYRVVLSKKKKKLKLIFKLKYYEARGKAQQMVKDHSTRKD